MIKGFMVSFEATSGERFQHHFCVGCDEAVKVAGDLVLGDDKGEISSVTITIRTLSPDDARLWGITQ